MAETAGWQSAVCMVDQKRDRQFIDLLSYTADRLLCRRCHAPEPKIGLSWALTMGVSGAPKPERSLVDCRLISPASQ